MLCWHCGSHYGGPSTVLFCASSHCIAELTRPCGGGGLSPVLFCAHLTVKVRPPDTPALFHPAGTPHRRHTCWRNHLLPKLGEDSIRDGRPSSGPPGSTVRYDSIGGPLAAGRMAVHLVMTLPTHSLHCRAHKPMCGGGGGWKALLSRQNAVGNPCAASKRVGRCYVCSARNGLEGQRTGALEGQAAGDLCIHLPVLRPPQLASTGDSLTPWTSWLTSGHPIYW